MGEQGIGELPLCSEGRACKGPAAARGIEFVERLSAYELVAGDEVLKRHDPALSSAQRQTLGLLGVPASACLAH
ncbi:MAG: hypothetical protein ACYDB7_03095 [Mycobacteriales bacterium]